MLADIDKETVDFEDNYDGTQKQPTVLPAKLPEPAHQRQLGHRRRDGHEHPAAPPRRDRRRDDRPHRRPERHRPTTCADYVLGPDFPTGGTIYRFETRRNPLTGERETIDAIRDMYAHGHGRVVIRAQVAFEETKADRIAIIVTELPYQVNKATLLEKIADLVKEKRIDGIADLRDESDRDGMRIYVEIKRDVEPAQGAEQPVQAHADAAGVQHELLALVDGQPQTLSAQERPPALHRPPPRHRPPADRVRPRARRRPGPTSSRASRSPSTTSTR